MWACQTYRVGPPARVFLLVASGPSSVCTKVACRIQSRQADLCGGCREGGGLFGEGWLLGTFSKKLCTLNVDDAGTQGTLRALRGRGPQAPAMPTETPERTDDKLTLGMAALVVPLRTTLLHRLARVKAGGRGVSLTDKVIGRVTMSGTRSTLKMGKIH